jgi:hypothetical protein
MQVGEREMGVRGVMTAMGLKDRYAAIQPGWLDVVGRHDNHSILATSNIHAGLVHMANM